MESELNGIRLASAQYFTIGWKFGPPRGVMIHSSTGYLAERVTHLNNLGSSVHFSVDTNGEAMQFVSLRNRSWHAFEASDYYFGIEHLFPDDENHYATEEQLKKSAEIAGQVIKLTKEIWGMTIPIIRAPGPGFSPGFKEHRDGIEGHWNPRFHRDYLLGPITWQNYLDSVKISLEEDDMAIFESKEDFRKETLKALVGYDLDGNPILDSNQFAESLRLLLGMSLRMKGDTRPDRADAFQKGWDIANQLMSLDPESFDVKLPQAKLSGLITFSQSS